MSAERRRLYSIAFLTLFKWVEKLTGDIVRWQHLHGSGIIGVTVDMDGKQMSGMPFTTRSEPVPNCLDRLWSLLTHPGPT